MPASVVVYGMVELGVGHDLSSSWWEGGYTVPRALARGTETPEDDLGLVHDEAVRLRRIDAGRGADDAVDVLGGAAAPAHDVVVVVADPALVARRVPGGLDAAHEPGIDAGRQHVVDGLGGDGTELGAHARTDRVGRGVRVLREPGEHGSARRGDPQARRAQGARAGVDVGHALDPSLFWNESNLSRVRIRQRVDLPAQRPRRRRSRAQCRARLGCTRIGSPANLRSATHVERHAVVKITRSGLSGLPLVVRRI